MSFDSPLPPYNASDPSATFLNSSCLDLLMIELVPMAYRVVNEVDAANLDERIESTGSGSVQTGSVTASRGTNSGGEGKSGKKMDEDEERDAVFFRLEILGYRVGQGLVERYVFFHFCELWKSCSSSSRSFTGPLASLEETTANCYASQILQRQTALHRHTGCYQISLQRPLDAGLQETN